LGDCHPPSHVFFLRNCVSRHRLYLLTHIRLHASDLIVGAVT
jgi:hypothetical protein